MSISGSGGGVGTVSALDCGSCHWTIALSGSVLDDEDWVSRLGDGYSILANGAGDGVRALGGWALGPANVLWTSPVLGYWSARRSRSVFVSGDRDQDSLSDRVRVLSLVDCWVICRAVSRPVGGDWGRINRVRAVSALVCGGRTASTGKGLGASVLGGAGAVLTGGFRLLPPLNADWAVAVTTQVPFVSTGDGGRYFTNEFRKSSIFAARTCSNLTSWVSLIPRLDS